jgi:hypothetical protein
MGRASFNLHKTQYISVPPDQVDLPSAARRPKVAGNNNVIQTSQMKESILFSPPAGALMQWPLIAGQEAQGKPV